MSRFNGFHGKRLKPLAKNSLLITSLKRGVNEIAP
jgi:hypothetical protein